MHEFNPSRDKLPINTVARTSSRPFLPIVRASRMSSFDHHGKVWWQLKW